VADSDFSLDNYKLTNCLAQGHHSQIWEALEGNSTKKVAVKLLLPEAQSNRELRQSMKYEAKVAKALDHPNIIKVHAVVSNRKNTYIVMELFRCLNVKVQMRNDKHGVHLRARKLIESTCEALNHMHSRGWIHKDIKPENILLNKSSEVRLIDFSLAGRPSGSIGQMVGMKKRGAIQGTRTYMAPEQIRNRPLSSQTDIYGLGVTIFEILAGRPPFCSQHPDELLMEHLKTAPPAPSDFNRNITPEMDSLILKALAKTPKNRHNDMVEFLTEFRNTRIFKEDIKEDVVLSEEEQEAALLADVEKDLDTRLDSRMDAMRSAARKRNPNATPEPPKPIPEKRPAPKVVEQPAAAPQPAQPQALTPEQQHQQAMQQQAAYHQQAMQQQAMQQQAAYQQHLMNQQALHQQAMYQQAMQQGGQFAQPPQPPVPGQPAMPPQVPMQPNPQQPQPAEPAATAQQPEEKAKQQPTPEQGTEMKITDMEMFDSLPDIV